MSALKRVVDHLAAHDPDEDRAAVDALLDAWEDVAAREIRELLDLVLLRLARGGHELDPAVQFERWPADEVAFTMVTYKKRAVDVASVVLAVSQRAYTSYNSGRRRVFALLEYRYPDPRFIGLARLYGVPSGYLEWDLYNHVDVLLERSGDPRVIDVLRTCAQPPKLNSFYYLGGEQVQQRARGLGDRLAEVFRDRRTALTRDEHALVLEARQHLSETIQYEAKRKEMLARITEDPADVSRVHVFADWLLEHADPAAPFFARKIAGDDDVNVSATLESERWLGPLELAVKVTERKHGLPTRCMAWATLGPTIGAPAWSTIERLDVGNCEDPPEVVVNVVRDAVTKGVLRYVSLPLATASALLSEKIDLARLMIEVTSGEEPVPTSFLHSLRVPLDGVVCRSTTDGARVAFELMVRHIEITVREPTVYKVILTRDPFPGPWTKLAVEYTTYLNQTDMIDSFRGIPDSALRSVDIRMAPRKTDSTEARPLPLSRTHLSTLAARFPQAQTSIRAY